MLQKNDQTNIDNREGADQARTNHEAENRSRGGRAAAIFGRLTRGFAQILLMAAVLAVAYLGTMRLVNTRPEVPTRPVFPTVYTVDTQITELEDVQPTIRLYGETVAARSVDLRALVSGEIVAVNDRMQAGQNVARGDVLLEIDPFNYEGALREARANAAETQARIAEAEARLRLERARLVSSRDQLELARSDLARIEQLRTRGTATEKQVEDRKLILSQREQAVDQSEINIVAEEARIEQLRAAAERLAWKVEQSERNLASTRLTAPFDGTIRSSSAEIGKLANVNDVLVSMYQAESLEARFVLTDEQFGRLQADSGGIIGRNMSVTWNVGGIDYTFPAIIERIGADIATARGGVEVFATIDTSGNKVTLRPGAFVELTLPDRTFERVVRLPETALFGGDTVYVVENGELAERKVQVTAFQGENVLIASGLNEGEEVLLTRIAEISPGLKVRKEGDPEPGRRPSEQGDGQAGQQDARTSGNDS